uniref:RING-CH-type domain-containing protein n=1 Tax=Ascaris lumbricoides TaxID=6252 RepID=A0A9J2PBD5_ASCLU
MRVMRMTRHLSVVNLLDGCIFFAQWLSMAGIELTDRSQASTAREGSNEETESDSLPLAEKTAQRENGEITGIGSQCEAAEESASFSERARSLPITLQPNAHKNAPTQIKICNTPPTSPTESSSAVEKRACRICQSETGVFVRPCACAGTNLIELASVVCLSLCLWYMLALTRERQFIERVFYAGIPPRSPDIARICKHIREFISFEKISLCPYRSNLSPKPLQVVLQNYQGLYECIAVVTLLIAATLAGGVMNIVTRWSFSPKPLQVVLQNYQELYECIAVVTLLIAATLAGGVMNIVTRVCHYINKQKAIHFVDSQANKKRTA